MNQSMNQLFTLIKLAFIYFELLSLRAWPLRLTLHRASKICKEKLYDFLIQSVVNLNVKKL